jgi:hypothetical protein
MVTGDLGFDISPLSGVVFAARKRLQRCVAEFQHGRVGLGRVKGVLASFLGYMGHCNGIKSAQSVLSSLKWGVMV